MQTYTLALADDHPMMRDAIKNIIVSSNLNIAHLFDAPNGKTLLTLVSKEKKLDLAVLDINMPEMDGFETAQALKTLFPNIKLLAFTMLEDEDQLLKIFKTGFHGYLSKESSSTYLVKAIQHILDGFTFFPHKINQALRSTNQQEPEINEREMEFLKYSCTDDTYAQIADKMNLSPKTIDGYRAKLFERFEVKSRTGLAIYALREGLIRLEDIEQ